MKAAQLILMLAVFTVLPGCGYLVCGYHDIAGWTSRQWSAEKAWQSRKWIYADMPCRGSFKAGFKAGYRFANGGYDLCEPPQYRHYWRIGGLTETERLNAQAWSDGFTHGTVAAQQDHAVGPAPSTRPPCSRRRAFPTSATIRRRKCPPTWAWAAIVPAERTGDAALRTAADDAGFRLSVADGPERPVRSGSGEFPYAPIGNNNSQYSPPPIPVPAPASEAMPTPPSPAPGRGMPFPPPAPASVPTTAAEYFPTRMMTSEAYPGVGNLTATVNPQSAPPAEGAATGSLNGQPPAAGDTSGRLGTAHDPQLRCPGLGPPKNSSEGLDWTLGF